jgi:hypothetical protein
VGLNATELLFLTTLGGYWKTQGANGVHVSGALETTHIKEVDAGGEHT